mgnify:CR=1 FL=1
MAGGGFSVNLCFRFCLSERELIMSLRDKFRNSRRSRARDITVQGIGDFKLLIPSVARLPEIREQAKKNADDEPGMIRFMALIVAQHVVDENFERVYTDDEIDAIITELDPFALLTIYGHILNGQSPDEAAKNSEPTPSVTPPSA